MRLTGQLRRQGEILFRWRGIVPLAFLPLVVLAFPESQRINQLLGEEFDHAWFEKFDHALFYGCLTLSYFGLAIRWVTVGFVPSGTSGRNTHGQRAEQLNTLGAYSVVRNPLYVGNFLALFGVILFLKVWWLVLLFVLAYALYIERVVAAEEAYLRQRFGTAYDVWATVTPAFLPRFGNWRPPEVPFSLLTVLRREYSGVMAVASAYLILEFVLDVLIDGEPVLLWATDDVAWIVVAVVAAVIYITLRTLKRRTNLLRVAGR